ncbi:hypothetical protein AALP_AA1G322300 [Arabis alpina]|uniref:MADS-box domain-containing protein n=1 Tax=Arabis alpina TaxID=50452 RepID=A0A087HS36_ARAAL|nr:hypothetical protein AALP_AA1G322300 [Arabis alpina]
MVKLKLIPKESTRKQTFKKRKGGFMKKLHELTTVCGVKACAVVVSKYDPQPEVWPSKEGVEEVVSKVMEVPLVERTKRMVDKKAYLLETIKKEEKKVMKMHDENRDSQMRDFMLNCLKGNIKEYDYDENSLRDFRAYMCRYLHGVNHRIQILTANGQSSSIPPLMDNGQPLSFPPLKENGQSSSMPPLRENGQSLSLPPFMENGQSSSFPPLMDKGKSLSFPPPLKEKGQSFSFHPLTENFSGQSLSFPPPLMEKGQSSSFHPLTENFSGQSLSFPPPLKDKGQSSSFHPLTENFSDQSSSFPPLIENNQSSFPPLRKNGQSSSFHPLTENFSNQSSTFPPLIENNQSSFPPLRKSGQFSSFPLLTENGQTSSFIPNVGVAEVVLHGVGDKAPLVDADLAASGRWVMLESMQTLLSWTATTTITTNHQPPTGPLATTGHMSSSPTVANTSVFDPNNTPFMDGNYYHYHQPPTGLLATTGHMSSSPTVANTDVFDPNINDYL